MKCVIVVLTLLFCVKAQYEFPTEFEFGVATASYQIEGAWNDGGKGENIWDRMTHQRPDLIDDGSTGDHACLSYYKTDEDVGLLTDLGVDFYRFSISWSRILPNGHANQINQEGIDYYNELINRLIAARITPFVTMFHWDLPQPLQEIGGWPNPFLADIFVDYANILYKEFGDRVTDWITFNEPLVICEQGYSTAGKAPAYTQDGIGGYLCAHTLLIAHGKAYRLYYRDYFEEQKGRVGITLDSRMYMPADEESQEDLDATERAFQFVLGWYANPIFSKEEIMKSRIEAQSQEEGFLSSRLPSFTDEEIQIIRGSADFLGLNHYTSEYCTTLTGSEDVPRPSHSADIDAFRYQSPDWESSGSVWLKVYPEGLRKLLVWIKQRYNNPEIMITENGFSDRTGTLADCRRVNYFNSYLEQVLLAIHEDEVNVTRYAAWSFMDNFEWRRGYTERFGIYYVDFEDDDKPRTPKMSAFVFKNIMQTRGID
ncbi:Glycosyl hydrolase family 1 [Popillia japonica]|uniref:Glycosyl hydrolase family 1 n=1 Tax=Popillia japonica TaxID=7064 RepID=A0AAW1LSC4_POPJA